MFKCTTTTGKVEYIHDVIGFTRVGTHTYEFTTIGAHGERGKLRVTDVILMEAHVGCLCHSMKD